MTNKFVEILERRQLLSVAVDAAMPHLQLQHEEPSAIVMNGQRSNEASESDDGENASPAVTATLQATPITTASSGRYKFTVTYDPSSGVRHHLHAQQISVMVTGPQGYEVNARLVSWHVASDDTITATYSIRAPKGGWNATANGTYMVSQSTRGSSDDDDQPSVTQLGTFDVAIDTTPGPVANVAPSFTVGANQTVAQDSGAKTVANWATGISAGPASEAGQTLSFTATTNNDALFAVKPSIATNGTLSFTPAAGVSGAATVTVLLKDSGGTANGGADTSAAKTFTVTVTPTAVVVNAAPSFTVGANQTVAQDSGAKTVANWATGISAGPASESGQTLTFQATTNNDALFAVKPSIATNGTLSFTPAAGVSGAATVTVLLKDSGGTANGGVDTSAAKTFTVTVTPTAVVVNAAPSFTVGANQTVAQDSGAKTVANWATNISAGPLTESGQTLSFTATTNNDSLFAVKPSIAANGTLSFTPAAGASGVATVTVLLKDSGGTANAGVDTSAAKTFTITVTPTPVVVNVAPSFTAGANQTVAQDSGAKTVANWATGISAGPASESGQTLTFTATTNNDALFAVKPSIAANGTLTFTPAAGASGVATVTVLLKDSGGDRQWRC